MSLKTLICMFAQVLCAPHPDQPLATVSLKGMGILEPRCSLSTTWCLPEAWPGYILQPCPRHGARCPLAQTVISKPLMTGAAWALYSWPQHGPYSGHQAAGQRGGLRAAGWRGKVACGLAKKYVQAGHLSLYLPLPFWWNRSSWALAKPSSLRT